MKLRFPREEPDLCIHSIAWGGLICCTSPAIRAYTTKLGIYCKVNKEEILHDYNQKPGAFIPEFVALDDLAEIYLNNPGFHSSFEDFMEEWQEEDNAVECEF